jgi:hypothetical protein
MELKKLTAHIRTRWELFLVLVVSMISFITKRPLLALCEFKEYAEMVVECNNFITYSEQQTTKIAAMQSQMDELVQCVNKLNALAADYGDSAVSRNVRALANRLTARIESLQRTASGK